MEPFDTFKPKVTALCQNIWHTLPSSAIAITRMEDAFFHRVISITITHPPQPLHWFHKISNRFLQTFGLDALTGPESSKPEEFVISIPRRKNYPYLQNGIAMMFYLNLHSAIKAPRIKFFDLTANNAIGKPYTIQHRIPGKPAQYVYKDLNTGQRITFARELGTALSKMMKDRVMSPGTLDPEYITTFPQIECLECPFRDGYRAPLPNSPFPTSSIPQTVFSFLETQFKRQRAYDLSQGVRVNPWSKLWPIVVSMNEMGLFTDHMYYLTHMDFEPRNIMVDVTSPTTATLSGILDWDDAVFAPVFMHCTPPYWLWDLGYENGHKSDDVEEAKANDTPADEGLQQVKKAFEDAAGKLYLKYAYTPEYRMARTITRIAITGPEFLTNDYDDIEKTIRKWNTRYPDKKTRELYEVDSHEECEYDSDEEYN
ncbi:hypothetical protein K505DRAFT_258060 [Melanomma pulvis-pyrius CBS 109.77]|uniref:Uncharacterized protein n=1 Tax=Melanomma pulvis-pyrius CBS 109.77 TaxID=1314802 RepID=A0A6A6WT60_9PLEO|nr:hypothetical protein K505DRAFT_258060 [Melanomma pulvis-pyrius CBS 109.77]